MNHSQIAQKRTRGRPKLAHPLTPAQRSKRYRERLRQRIDMNAAAVLALLFEEVEKSSDPIREQQWRYELQADFEQLEKQFKATFDAASNFVS